MEKINRSESVVSPDDYEVLSGNAEEVKLVNTSPDGTRRVGYVVKFKSPEQVEVVVYSLLSSDHPGASYDKGTSSYWAYSSDHHVGDYDDQNIKDVVSKAADRAGIKIPENAWFKEEK